MTLLGRSVLGASVVLLNVSPTYVKSYWPLSCSQTQQANVHALQKPEVLTVACFQSTKFEMGQQCPRRSQALNLVSHEHVQLSRPLLQHTDALLQAA